MTTLNLGVHDQAYAAAFTSRGGKPRTLTRAQKAYGAGKSTGQIAEILEARYGIMRAFFENKKADVIIPAIEKSVKGSLLNILAGQPAAIDVSAQGMSTIAARFKDSLSMRSYDQWIGRGGRFPVPTGASLAGVSIRHKSGFTPKRAARPSFINSGLYQSSFVAWMS